MRFVFAMFDGGGNVEPLVAVGRCLLERGHDVRVLAGPPLLGTVVSPAFVGRLERAGFRVVPLRRHLSPVRPTERSRGLLLGRSTRLLGVLGSTHLIYYWSGDWTENLVRLLREEPADVVATDYMLPGALIAAESAGVPAAALLHTIHFFRPAPGVPPTGLGLFPLRGPLGRVRDALAAAAARRLYARDATPKLNAVRASLGMRPLRYPFEEFDRTDRVLVMTSPAFDLVPRVLPPNVRYTGMPFEPADEEPEWTPPWADEDGRPIVLVAYSTNAQGQELVLRRLLLALGQLDVRAVVTVGRSVDKAAFAAPPNVWLVEWAPHDAVLRRAALLVTHGGHGTVMKGLRRGVPIVCTPLCCDQYDVGVRIALRGVGERLSARSSVDQLRAALRRVLSDRRYRDAAGRLASRMAAEDGAATAADELEAIAARRSAPLAR